MEAKVEGAVVEAVEVPHGNTSLVVPQNAKDVGSLFEFFLGQGNRQIFRIAPGTIDNTFSGTQNLRNDNPNMTNWKGV